ncbi:MAG: alpha/beta fold hydrolase [Vicinamibacterales bacterium]
MTASQALAAFRDAAPVQRLRLGGVEWRYRASGSRPHGLLLLPGAVGDGDAYFTLDPSLSPTHKLIAIAYPPVDSQTRMLDGLRDILDREGILSTDIVGGSFGGLIAQAFLQRYPQRTRRVVLSATGPAKPARAASNEKFARIVGRLPIGVTRMLLRAIVRASLRPVNTDRRFWRDFYFDAIAVLSRNELMARYALSADLDRQGPPSPAGRQEWTGEVLILEGDADAIAHVGARDSLKALYPGAQIRTFPGAGHAISAERRPEWAATIAEFLSLPRVSDTVLTW